MQAAVIMIPFLAAVFDVTALNLQQWGIVAVLSFIPVLFVEFEKKILK